MTDERIFKMLRMEVGVGNETVVAEFPVTAEELHEYKARVLHIMDKMYKRLRDEMEAKLNG